MVLHQLLKDIESIAWFTRLGEPPAQEEAGVVYVASLAQWRDFVTASSQQEWGLQGDGDGREWPAWTAMSWLPTSYDEPDPVHGDALQQAACATGTQEGLAAARMEAARAAARSQKAGAAVHPALHVGAVDLTAAAFTGGRYACRMAAAEAFMGQPGFWCGLIAQFRQGRWPLGLQEDGGVVVL